MMTMREWWDSHCTGAVFGGRAVELAGRVVHPEFQAKKIGKTMLRSFITDQQPHLLTTYTRNPAIIRMIRGLSDQIFPYQDYAAGMKYIARRMPNAEIGQYGTVYHFDRYQEGGLFKGFDPADQPLEKDGPSLKELFPQLSNPRHALVVAARALQDYDYEQLMSEIDY